jgi:CRP/FNR family transcriptional regulator, cyclic AMP receptor protein
MHDALRAGPPSLAEITIFRGLREDEFAALWDRLRRRRFRKGATVFLHGDPGDDLYVVEAGSVKICMTTPDGKEITLAILGPGEIFGELALMDGAPRSSNAVTMEDCQLLLLERSRFIAFVDEHPSVARSIIEVLSRRLRDNNELVQDAAFFDVAGRLARVILRLADSVGSDEGGAIMISRRLTQNDLAGMIGTTRESVNKWLTFYERQGLIDRNGGLMRVLDAEGLRNRIT